VGVLCLVLVLCFLLVAEKLFGLGYQMGGTCVTWRDMRNKYGLKDTIKFSSIRIASGDFENLLCPCYISRNVSLFSFQPFNTGVSLDRCIVHSFSVIASDYKFKDVLVQIHKLYMRKTRQVPQKMVFSFKGRSWQAILLRWLIETAPPVTDRVNPVNNVTRLAFCVIANRN